MPVVAIGVRRLQERLGEARTVEELVECLESLGCDVEGSGRVTVYHCPACRSPLEALEKDPPPQRCPSCGHSSGERPFEAGASDEVVRLNLLPARPDLLDPGGLARSIKGYLGVATGLPEIPVSAGSIEVVVDRALERERSYRPHIACAEVDVPPLDEGELMNLMKLQENLHWAIGRDRKLASIGVYDLTKIRPPIQYRAVGPDELRFVPLGMPGTALTPRQILDVHPKGRAYRHLLDSFDRYPLLVDAKGQVLSMPPIINSDETKVAVGSKSLFIDVTGITPGDVERALATIVASLAEIGGVTRTVRIAGPGAVRTTPDLAPRSIEISLAETNRWLGLALAGDDLVRLLSRMRLAASGGPDRFTVKYVPYRTDFKHPVDVMEDVAIAYGYRNLQLSLVPHATVGRERPDQALANRARAAMTGLGHVEIMSLLQDTQAIGYERLRLETPAARVHISNPKAVELDGLRTHLLGGLLATLEKNKHKPVPVRLFEVGTAVALDDSAETGARETLRLAVALMGPSAGYADVRSVTDAVLAEIGRGGVYRAADCPTFIAGRFAEVDLEDGLSARLGEVHPEVLVAFGLAYPVAMAEIELARIS